MAPATPKRNDNPASSRHRRELAELRRLIAEAESLVIELQQLRDDIKSEGDTEDESR